MQRGGGAPVQGLRVARNSIRASPLATRRFSPASASCPAHARAITPTGKECGAGAQRTRPNGRVSTCMAVYGHSWSIRCKHAVYGAAHAAKGFDMHGGILLPYGCRRGMVDRLSVVVMTESWQVCSCRFESHLAQCHSRRGGALVVWLYSTLVDK